MRLYEITSIIDEPMFKGQSANPEVVVADAWEQRVEELRGHIKGWKLMVSKMGEGPGKEHNKYIVSGMEDELRDLEEIGELPFTFYAAREYSDAEFFSDQFEDGVVDEVKLSAKKLAAPEDLRALGFPKRTVSHLTPRQIHELKKAGFDGATGEIDRVGGVEVVVFSPEQVKRA